MRNTILMAGAALGFGMLAAAAPSQASPGLPHMSAAGNYVVQARDDDDDDHHGNRRSRPQYQSESRRSEGREHEREREHEHEHHGRRFQRAFEFQFNACRSVRHQCAENFDVGSWRFRRCVRRNGC
jgi:hypothetical protein